MNMIVDGWREIEIRNDVCIDEFCYIDDKGELKIEVDVSSPTYCKIVLGEHGFYGSNFEFNSKPVGIHLRV